MMLAISVTMIPSSSETMIVRVLKMSPLLGSVNPTASNSLNSPIASARPRNSPTIDASVPIHERLDDDREAPTWRRDAPRVRSVVSSRVRWAIVIESELKMTNAPTNRAITPNASRK